jgi:peptide deformylase
MIYRVVKYGDPVLEKVAAPVLESEFGSAELRQFVADMFETMYASKGIGLAAPQVGVAKRVLVIDTEPSRDEEDPPGQKVVAINPEITLKEGVQVGEEGCLSIPGFREDVSRSMRVVVKARDENGGHIEVDATELLARAFQHEMDHLDGILFISRISPLKRDIIRRKIKKLAKQGEWE